MQTIIPPSVLELSEHNQLGAFVRKHHERTLIRIASKSVNITMFAIVFLLALLETLSVTPPTNVYRPINNDFFFPIVSCIFFLILFGSQLMNAFGQRGRNQQVYEFAKGMIIVKGRKKLFLVRWENISTLTYTFEGAASPGYQIVASGNEQYKLFCDTIIPRIEQELIKRYFSEHLARYVAGEVLKFDTISVCKEGILNLRKPRNQALKVVHWNEFQPHIQERNYAISLTKRADGKRYSFSLYNMSNACILRELLTLITSPAFNIIYQQALIMPPQPIWD